MMRTVCLLAALLCLLAQGAWAQESSVLADEFVRIGDIEQWISVRGHDRRNPVILVLHGGPGVTNAPFAPAFAEWRNDFTVVEWDQRGAGRTFGRNGAQGSRPLTIERLTADGIELAEHLRDRLDKDKVALLGISFGSIVGLHMVQSRPDLFSAYVGTGQVVSRMEGDALGYELTLNRARAVGHAEGAAALETMGPPPWPDATTWNAAKGWANRLTPESDPGSQINLPAIMRSLPGLTDADLRAIVGGAAFSAEALAPHESMFDALQLGVRYAVPMFVFQGRGDINAPTELVSRWFAQVEAPEKQLVIVDNASHAAFFTHSEELGQLLVEKVRPLAAGGP
ncbi:MAG: alpha/beta hydrolase [Vicinamibacterales bacterium]|jgi:pimeloyl-ACP methyl ester carboxylesterase|nr:alpha/beta hydrolase [Vicinamibacterales bacterium]